MAMTLDDLAADALWAEAKQTHDQLHTAADPDPECDFCQEEH